MKSSTSGFAKLSSSWWVWIRRIEPLKITCRTNVDLHMRRTKQISFVRLKLPFGLIHDQLIGLTRPKLEVWPNHRVSTELVSVTRRCVQKNPGNSNSEGKRKTARVIGVDFSDILIKGKEIKLELVGYSSYPSSSYRGSNCIFMVINQYWILWIYRLLNL